MQEAIRRLASFAGLHTEVQVGKRITRTVDLFTVAAMAILIDPDPAIVAADLAAIHKLQSERGLFSIKGDTVTPRARMMRRKQVPFA